MSQLYRLADSFGSLNDRSDYRAVNTCVKRPPKKGEWYLSGAIIEGYKAPNDLSSEYYIARIVKVETESITYIVEEY